MCMCKHICACVLKNFYMHMNMWAYVGCVYVHLHVRIYTCMCVYIKHARVRELLLCVPMYERNGERHSVTWQGAGSPQLNLTQNTLTSGCQL